MPKFKQWKNLIELIIATTMTTICSNEILVCVNGSCHSYQGPKVVSLPSLPGI